MKPRHDAKAAARDFVADFWEPGTPDDNPALVQALAQHIHRHCPSYVDYIERLQAALREEADNYKSWCEENKGDVTITLMLDHAAALENLAAGPEGVNDGAGS